MQLGMKITDLTELDAIARINEGAIAEQWIGQHLLDLRMNSQPPELYYWVREKAGSMAEVDYIIQNGMQIYPIEVKAGASSRAKSLQVFLNEKKKSPIGIHFSTNPARFDPKHRILELPFYMVEQVPRILTMLQKSSYR